MKVNFNKATRILTKQLTKNINENMIIFEHVGKLSI